MLTSHFLLPQGNMAELRVLRRQRDALDDQIQRLEWQLRHAQPGACSGGQLAQWFTPAAVDQDEAP